MGRWQRYWFAEGGRFAAAIVRMAIAIAVLACLIRLGRPTSSGDLPGEHTLYRPVGMWMLLGHIAPPELVVDALRVLAWAATLAMLAGLYTRTATAVSFVSACALASLAFASSSTWSHQYNVVFLAQLAFLGARGGDVLSVDALLRRRRALPPEDRARGYQWSLRLVQLAVALMFACAAFHKILHGHFTLRWALSDNLRNQLLVRFDLAGLPRPPLVDWLLDDPWRYRTAAVLNLMSQAVPILACLLVRRPVWRAIAGMFFIVETVALGLVVGLWNLQWLPLFAVFVDWDALARRLFRRPRGYTLAEPPPGWSPPRAARIWIAVFVAYDLVTAIAPGLDQWLNTFPFSGFPMFSTVLAKPPYGGHTDFVVDAGHFEVTSEPPIDASAQRWFDHTNRGMFAIRDPVALRARLAATLAQAQRRFPWFKLERLRLDLARYVAPAYPSPARLEPHAIAAVGELDADGTFRTMVGAFDAEHLAPHPVGVDPTGASVTCYRDDELVGIPCTRAPDGDPIYIVATTPDGTPWLVASHAAWRWQ